MTIPVSIPGDPTRNDNRTDRQIGDVPETTVDQRQKQTATHREEKPTGERLQNTQVMVQLTGVLTAWSKMVPKAIIESRVNVKMWSCVNKLVGSSEHSLTLFASAYVNTHHNRPSRCLCTFYLPSRMRGPLTFSICLNIFPWPLFPIVCAAGVWCVSAPTSVLVAVRRNYSPIVRLATRRRARLGGGVRNRNVT